MKIKESIELHCSADAVWDILKNPGNMPVWNPKCTACSGNDKIKIGTFFEAEFKLGSKAKNTSCNVIELTPFEKITIRYSGEAFSSKDGFVDESFIIIKKGINQTKILLEVDFTNSNLPVMIKIIMWFMNTFGYKAGRSSLDGIKDLIEQ